MIKDDDSGYVCVWGELGVASSLSLKVRKEKKIVPKSSLGEIS